MEADLRDALIAWQGGELPAGRTDELLARLREDAEFRRAFADEVWTLSLTRVAQAPDPRWLALHEELGLAPSIHEAAEATAGEAELMNEIRRAPLRFVDAAWRRIAYGAMAAAAVLALAFGLWALRPSPESPGAAVAQTLAVLVRAENAVWRGEDAHALAAGSRVPARRLQLATGRASLVFTNGVTLDFEGPADLDLLTGDRVLCREGRLRTKVPPGAEGFCVETPRGAVTDLGTELGISVARDGHTHVAVFEGKAEVSLQIPGQNGVRTALLDARQTAEMLPATGEIRAGRDDGFLAAEELRLPPLPLAANYAETILAAQPAHYWRLDRTQDSAIPNEVANGPALRLAGGVRIQPDEFGRTSASFPGRREPGALYLGELWTKPAEAHAIELWFATPSTEQIALAALTTSSHLQNHIALVELATRRPGRSPEPGILRYLLRWPSGTGGGVNIYSEPHALPYQWHHLVAQQSGGDMQLYLDGRLVGTARADRFPPEVRCTLQFGCLEYRPGIPPEKIERAFAGRLAEIAIYGRTLTPAEIQAHAALRK